MRPKHLLLGTLVYCVLYSVFLLSVPISNYYLIAFGEGFIFSLIVGYCFYISDKRLPLALGFWSALYNLCFSNFIFVFVFNPISLIDFIYPALNPDIRRTLGVAFISFLGAGGFIVLVKYVLRVVFLNAKAILFTASLCMLSAFPLLAVNSLGNFVLVLHKSLWFLLLALGLLLAWQSSDVYTTNKVLNS